MKSVTIIGLTILQAIVCHSLSAQHLTRNNDPVFFTPREKGIFQDDFSEDTIGRFPHKWRLCVCNADKSPINNHDSKVDEDSTCRYIAMKTDPRHSTVSIEPDMRPDIYLNDSFTLEYDFNMVSEETRVFTSLQLPEIFCSGETFYLYKNGNGYSIEYESNAYGEIPGAKHYKSIRPIADFDYQRWHHFALSFYKRVIHCYIDGMLVVNIADCEYTPGSFCISPEKDDAKFKNIKVATGEIYTPFKELLLSKKMTTHAIRFDPGKSDILPESMHYIDQLAEWLKSNTTVKIEIGGHTDGDGNAETNLKLSQERADEVKRQLVLQHVDAARMATKGYGATKPLQPNTTEKGKAENRRVEFMKQ